MKIVISGVGEMGSHLARMLSGHGHDITIIDSDAKALEEVDNGADLITIEGDTTAFAVLRKAGVRRCDLFIAVNHDENQNILAAIMAKQLGAKKSIARVDAYAPKKRTAGQRCCQKFHDRQRHVAVELDFLRHISPAGRAGGVGVIALPERDFPGIFHIT